MERGDPHHDIVITGMGVATRLGDLASTAKGARTGEVPPFEIWEPAVSLSTRCQVVGLYPHALDDDTLGIDRAESRFMGRAARLALRASRDAMAQSGVDVEGLAVVVASGSGDVEAHRRIHGLLEESRARRVGATVIPQIMSSTVSANLVNVLRATGASASVAAACAGGAWNLVVAAQLVSSGHAAAALAGGVEVADVHFHSGFDSMGAYTRVDNDRPDRASRPYAADRAGFVFAEGAGVLVVERRDRAEARGAPILAVLRGWGLSSDGQGQMVVPSASGALSAMSQALRHGAVPPEALDYVNTHATSTPRGDLVEALAVRELVGRPVAYSSTKCVTGHTISGAGAIEAALTATMLREGWIAPALHVDELDPALVEFPPVLEPTDATLRYALSNSFGFGGTNVSLLLERDA
ncbi:MAG: beta-ketoacyl synthase N-terminal-like domain-containing protein [Myxococcota bacterium]